jgi:ribonuclease-3
MNHVRITQLNNFKKKNNININNLTLLDTALTHPTYVFENKNRNLESNQRLEFLGDAVLGMIVAQYLYETYDQEPEGTLTKMRAAVVCESALARIAKKLQLGDYLNLGKGEELTGGRNRNSSLADAFEALVGAMYLDGGIDVAKEFLQRYIFNELKKVDMESFGDYKTMVQELSQKIYGENVSYQILSETGPDHNKKFEAGIYINNKLLAVGEGFSKKEAEQSAAKKAYSLLKDDKD